MIGKGSRPRIVLLPPPLVAILCDFLAEVRPQLPDSPLLLANAHPLVTTRNHGFGQEALAREVELAALGAGVPGRHYPHRWRHSFATELVRDGVDIHVVQRLLGHSSIASTVGYTHLAGSSDSSSATSCCRPTRNRWPQGAQRAPGPLAVHAPPPVAGGYGGRGPLVGGGGGGGRPAGGHADGDEVGEGDVARLAG